MKDGSTSGNLSARFEKDRVPFGCLIVHKKGDGISNRDLSRKQMGFDSKEKKKKRRRLILNDSESEEDLLIHDNSAIVVTNNNLDSFKHKEKIEIDRNKIRPKPLKCREDAKIVSNRFVGDGIYRKKSKMDDFEYAEDNEIEKKTLKKVCLDDKEVGIGSSSVLGSKRRDFENKCSKSVADDKRERHYFDRNSSFLVERSRGDDRMDEKRFEMEKDGTFNPLGTSRVKSGIPCGEPIRVQGKNGVLKVMLNKKVNGSEKPYGCREAKENRMGSSHADAFRPPFYSDKNFCEKSRPVVLMKKNRVSSQKSFSTKNNETRDWKTELRNKGETTLHFESNPSTKRKEGEVKRGNGTEKQLLRERIRRMLVNAGWKIDFRARKSRDYQDAVYINPSGTEYWSITKAYDALLKELEGDGTSSSFTPIPEDVLGQLKRQKCKKIESEVMVKHKANRGSENVKETHERKSKNQHVKVSMGNNINGKSHNSSGRALSVRSFNKRADSDNDNYIPYTGKRTVLSWMIDMGIVPMSGKVQYMNKRRTRAMLEGWITRDGIHCDCCSKILTISKFEIHAGSKLCQPFENIFVETGVSLLECQIESLNRQEISERSGFHLIEFNGDDPNDDTCGICGDGGDLICCDGCPSAFHQSCLGIQMLPQGDWHCPNCSCKFCGVVGSRDGQGEDITFSALHTCSMCARKYHQFCSQGTDATRIDSDSSSTSFCGQKCKELFQHLQMILGVKHEIEAGFSWTLIRRSDLDSDTSIHGLPEKAECNSKLAVAYSIMDECFLPIIDQRSGINLIHNVLYNCGSNFNRLNYSGFYTIILERGDEIISAASIRFHGTRLAEMPFIGTRHIYRRQGMCRRLLNVIESALCSLNVENLIIPAISELTHTWTTVFGFVPLEESQREELRFVNMLIFPGIDLLQKPLLRHNLTEENGTDSSVMKATELKSNHHYMTEVADKSDICSSVGDDNHASEKGIVHHMHEIENKVALVKTASHAPGDSIYDTSDMTCNPRDAVYGSISHAPEEEFPLDTVSASFWCDSSQ